MTNEEKHEFFTNYYDNPEVIWERAVKEGIAIGLKRAREIATDRWTTKFKDIEQTENEAIAQAITDEIKKGENV